MKLIKYLNEPASKSYVDSAVTGAVVIVALIVKPWKKPLLIYAGLRLISTIAIITIEAYQEGKRNNKD